MAKICNQVFVKDKFRNKKYAGTQKCLSCNHESHINLKFPFSVTDFISHTEAFVKLHTKLGCNKKSIDAPEWAAQTIDLAIVSQGDMIK